MSAALALVDEEGLPALSMRRLATKLGVDPMAIYYYLPNKAALQDAIVEAVNVEIEGPSEFTTLPLYDLVMTAGRIFRASLLAHPNTALLLAVRSLATPIGFEPSEAMLAGLVSGGLTPAEGISGYQRVLDLRDRFGSPGSPAAVRARARRAPASPQDERCVR